MLVAKPSHSTAGSKASEPSASPATTVSLRRIVLSAVEGRPVPHSVPGSNPIWPMTSTRSAPLSSATASLPLKLTEPLSWSAARMAGSLAELLLPSTKTSPGATVPTRVIGLAVVRPLEKILTA